MVTFPGTSGWANAAQALAGPGGTGSIYFLEYPHSEPLRQQKRALFWSPLARMTLAVHCPEV